ncbi:LysE family translocator [Rhodobacter capsulatus]|nr:LysE family translocator [Rhodobacter capsulatus]
MTPELWGTFVLTVLVLNLTPGPDMAYILSRTLAQGAPAGIMSAAGVCSGALFHVGLATLVFTISLQISEAMQTGILLAGGLYLSWLGINALREKPGTFEIIPASDRKMLRRIFLEGVVVDILNPKVALFFLALLPVFISDRRAAGF